MTEERRLTGLEKFLDAVDLVQPINFSLMLTMTGPLTFELLSAACKIACERLPNALLVPHNRGAPTSFFRKSPFMPRIEVASGGGLERILNQSINQRFDLKREAPIRLRWQPSMHQHLLVVTFLHTSADATSGLHWINMLLEALEHLINGTKLADSAPAITSMHTKNLDQRTPDQQHTMQTLRLEGARFANTRKTAVLGLEFSEAETQNISERIRARKLSLNTVLSAAHLQAVSTLFEPTPAMSLSFPVDLRRGRGLPADAYGCFVSEARIHQRITDNASTVALARRLERSLKSAVEAARPWNEKMELPLDPHRIYAARATTAVSNLGRYVPYKSHAFQLERIGFAVGCSILGDQVLTVLTTHNRMTCMLCWTVDTASADQIQTIGQRFRQNLLEL